MMSAEVRVPKRAVQEVILEPENIKLVKVLIRAKIVDITELPCSITCDEENGKVYVAGDDDFIADIATSIRQLAYEMAYRKVCQEGGFLCTAKGEQWIAEEFEKRDIPAIIYTKDQVTYILAKDEKHLDSATTNFNKIVRSQKVELDRTILSYLRSLKWKETVDDFQANYMVQVICDFNLTIILVRGRREDVKSVIASIKLLIHNKKSESSQHLPPTYLHKRSADYKTSQPDDGISEASSHCGQRRDYNLHNFGKSTSSEIAVPVVQEVTPTVAPKTDVPFPSAPVFAKHVLKSLPTAIKLLIQTPRTATTVIKKMPIEHSAIAELNDEVSAKILSFQSPHVQVDIDKSTSTITVIGAEEALVVLKQIIFKALSGDGVLQSDLSYIKKHKGVKAYLNALGRGWNCMKSCNPKREIPEYWTISSGQDAEDGLHVMNSSVPKRLLLAKGTPVYNAVELMVRRDALSRINVTNIWIVVNKVLFRNYQSKLKTFALKAADSSFRTITDLGEREIITKTVTGTDFISEHLVSEVNEAYLCHGTTHVNQVEKTGIDSRLCADFGYYGRGAYFAESSTKANVYAERMLDQTKRYMFVARVLLGEPFLCKKAEYSEKKLRRAPCSHGCKDRKKYSCTDDNHPMCDSVVGTGTDFREFIVYSPEQSYPEFVVEYSL